MEILTADSPIVGVPPRISESAFLKLLQGYPPASEGKSMYAVLEKRRVDPLGALGFFTHENELGTTGNCSRYSTHNLGDLRESTTGRGVKTAFGLKADGTPNYFCVYTTFTEAADDFAARLSDPHGPYAKCTTLNQIIPIYAPAPDGNVPSAYIQAVLKYMQKNYVRTENGHIMKGPIRIFWENQEAHNTHLQALGWPTSEIWIAQVDGMWRDLQKYERVVLSDAHTGDDWSVTALTLSQLTELKLV